MKDIIKAAVVGAMLGIAVTLFAVPFVLAAPALIGSFSLASIAASTAANIVLWLV